MPSLRAFLAVIPLAGLCACATRPLDVASTPDGRIAATRSATDSSYGLFLAGQAAINGGRGEAASAYFARAAALEPSADSRFLESRAFSAALLAGDVKKAAALAPTGASPEPGAVHLGAVVRGAEALAEGDGKRARAALTGPDVGAPHQ
nr:hypothetical protein [Caulobacteraceae bacterium]